MKKQATVRIAVLIAAGGLLFYLGHTVPGIVLWCIAGLLLFLAVFAPSVFQTLVELGLRIEAFVGTAIGVTFLTLTYYSVFLGGSLWLRLARIDPLNRRYPGQGESNWIDRADYAADSALYEKQFTRPHDASASKRP